MIRAESQIKMNVANDEDSSRCQTVLMQISGLIKCQKEALQVLMIVFW